MNDKLRLGDIVCGNETFPHFHEWRDAELKVVSLRVDPTGDQWVSVIEGSPRHRGNGVYDSETTDIKADWLTPISPAPVSPADGTVTRESIAQELVLYERWTILDETTRAMIYRAISFILNLPPSPAVAAAPDAWPDHPGATIDAVAFVEADKRYPQVDRDSVTDLSFADKQADRLGAFIEGFKRAIEMRARSPVRGDREAIARIIDREAFIIVNSKRWEIEARKDVALEKADAILFLPVQSGAGERETAIKFCITVVEEECGLKNPDRRTEHKRACLAAGEAIRDRLNCAIRNPDPRQAPHYSSESEQ